MEKLNENRQDELFLRDEALQSWIKEFVLSQNFMRLRMAVERRQPLRGSIQPTPHAQHVADGFRQGFMASFRIMQSIAESPFEPVEDDIFEGQLVDPDLDDKKDNE